MNIKPIGDRVIILPSPPEEKTASGIYIPQTAKEQPNEGTIVAVGEGKEDEPLKVKVNDKVIYGKHAGSPLEIEGETYLIMRESDIYAII